MSSPLKRAVSSRLAFRLLALLVLAGYFASRFLPMTPTIVRPPVHDGWQRDLIIDGRNLETVGAFVTWRSEYAILRVVNARHPRRGVSLLALTAEDPRPPQPRRSHLFLMPWGNISDVRPLSPEPDYNFWDMSVGDVDGDGRQEVALCTYSQTARDPNYARRFFVYGWDKQGDLYPMWRGSQLCRPYVTAALADVTGDDAAELVSVERALSGKLVVVVYRWNQFGFWGLGRTAEYDAIGTVTPLRTERGSKGLRIACRRGVRNLQVLWQP